MDSDSTCGIEEAAKMLRLSQDALMRKARAGKVPGAKIGRQWVFIAADHECESPISAAAEAPQEAQIIGAIPDAPSPQKPPQGHRKGTAWPF